MAHQIVGFVLMETVHNNNNLCGLSIYKRNKMGAKCGTGTNYTSYIPSGVSGLALLDRKFSV